MSAKEPPASGKGEYPYAAVETALADVFDVDPAAQRGWLPAGSSIFVVWD
jgi:hypothetical protein